MKLWMHSLRPTIKSSHSFLLIHRCREQSIAHQRRAIQRRFQARLTEATGNVAFPNLGEGIRPAGTTLQQTASVALEMRLRSALEMRLVDFIHAQRIARGGRERGSPGGGGEARGDGEGEEPADGVLHGESNMTGGWGGGRRGRAPGCSARGEDAFGELVVRH